MPRFKKSLADIKEENRQSEIRILNIKIVDCIEKMASIQSMMVACDDENNIAALRRHLETEIRKREIYIQQLAKLGEKAEGRGRPQKAQGQGYQEQRIKFTAWLAPENMFYLRELKSSKKISNISGFLDTLVASYRDSR